MPGPVETFDLRHSRGVTRHFYGADAIEKGLAEQASRLGGRSVFVVTSEPLRRLAGFGELRAALDGHAARTQVLVVPDGESAKCVAELERLWRQFAGLGGRRDSVVVAFGGGSVSDLAGFAAASFLRGIEWIGVPTTLLAQVDAAIGGKTGIDLPEAKNAAGAFHHPLAVLADPRVLSSLPADQWRSGLVEAVKTGAIVDRDLFERVERDLDRLLAGDPAAASPVLTASARAKARLVESDPQEAGPRKLLNFGHTLGHAIEAEAGYGSLLHGDAVGHGLRFALRLSRTEECEPDAAERLAAVLDRLGLPSLPALEVDRLLERIGRDKKARAAGIGWVLMSSLGAGSYDVRLAGERIRRELFEFLGPAAPPPL